MKLSSCIFLVTAAVAASAQRTLLRAPHVHPRQHYSPPPPYSPPVQSSTSGSDFPATTLPFFSTGIPSLTSSGLRNSSATHSTVVVTSRFVTITVITSVSSVVIVPSTKLVTTSCMLTDKGVIWCSNISPSSTPRPITGTFTDPTATSFPVGTSTSRFGPPISLSFPTGSSTLYLTTTTPPYSNGTSSTHSWATGTVSSSFTYPFGDTTSSGYYVPAPFSSMPEWDQSSFVPTNTLTLPVDISTASSATSSPSWSYTYSYPSYSYTYSYPSFSPFSSSYLTTPTPFSTPIYYPSKSVPDLPSTITFEFPFSITFSVPWPTPFSSHSYSRSRSRSRASSRLSRRTSASSFSISTTVTPTRSVRPSSSRPPWSTPTFLPWPPRSTLSNTRPYTSPYTPSSRSTRRTSTLSDSIPTSLDVSSTEGYGPPPSPSTFTDGTFSSWPIDTSTPPPILPPPPSPTPTSTLTGSTPYPPIPLTSTLSGATNPSWGVSTDMPSTFSTRVTSGADEGATSGYYAPAVPSLSIDVEKSGGGGSVNGGQDLARRQRGMPWAPKMSEDGVAYMRSKLVGGVVQREEQEQEQVQGQQEQVQDQQQEQVQDQEQEQVQDQEQEQVQDQEQEQKGPVSVPV
ncbi:hypothetical protein SVAN01_03703 [Stagonosporopsis vannaccii]|nr:hypothetical protein SVAN01_03703 [Stagonosporopsis vannaccii]